MWIPGIEGLISVLENNLTLSLEPWESRSFETTRGREPGELWVRDLGMCPLIPDLGYNLDKTHKSIVHIASVFMISYMLQSC